MTSKIEQDHQAQKAEAERLNKNIEREARDSKANETSRAAFSKLVTPRQQDQAEARAKSQRDQGEAKQGAQSGKSAQQAGNAERAARMSHGGVMKHSKVQEQARSFQGVLANQGSQTQEADKDRVEGRLKGTQKDAVEKEDRGIEMQKQETKRDVEAEQQRVEAREQARPNAAINAGSGGEKGEQRGDPGAKAIAVAKASEAKEGAHGVKQIPPELLEKLVSAVYLAVNDKGLKEFHIELKDGPLKGGLLKISADDGKIALSFQNLGADEKRLVEASKGELMRRLENKGLTLSRLNVQ